MARFQWMAGNLGFYGYDRLGSYVTTAFSATGMTRDYDSSLGALDPTIMAAQVSFTFANVTSYVVETGPDAGQVRVTGGTLTGITYLNATGDALLTVTGLTVLLPIFLATLERGDDFSAWSMVMRGANTILGSAGASGIGHAGTGDAIDTGTGADDVAAAGGDDYIKDKGGADIYNGGNGYDTLAYDCWYFRPQDATRGVFVDLGLGTATGPDGAIDTILGIEAVTGTFRQDQFKGDGAGNKFSGLAGADRIDGRGGFDFASYALDAGQGGTDGVKVNLTTGTGRDGFGNLDRLVSIEGVEGTAAADSFTDNGANNYFDGGAGNDILRFSGGNDSGHGGAGADVFLFKGTAYDDDTIDDFSAAEGDVVLFDAATSFGQLHLVNVAGGVNVQFGSGAVTLLGLTLAQLSADDFGF